MKETVQFDHFLEAKATNNTGFSFQHLDITLMYAQ